MIGEVMLGNANVCSYQIALQKNIQDGKHSAEKWGKGKGRITCSTLLVLSVDKKSHSPLLYNL